MWRATLLEPNEKMALLQLLPVSLSRRLETTFRILKNNKRKLAAYTTTILVLSLLICYTFGENYDGKQERNRGRSRREAALEKGKEGAGAEAEEFKDPFPSRPRIKTRNGHIVFEASQDKNIDFRTSGSRGTITVNGHKIDQLLEVTKALEKSSTNLKQQSGMNFESLSEQYEWAIGYMLTANKRLADLEKTVNRMKEKVKLTGRRLDRAQRKWPKRVSSLEEAQKNLTLKLKQNDCLSPETGEAVCKNGATCLDGYEDFRCLCPANWEGKTCASDVDECAKFRGTDLGCQNGAKCINYPGGYRCECPAQFHGVHCTDQHDDCAMSSSRSLCGYGKCLNLARQVPNQPRYECVCDQGWTTDGTNPACVIDINECLAGSPAQSLLADQNQTASGGLLERNSVAWPNSLQAAYPCSQNPFVECLNLPGSFKCGACPAGYTGNGRVCRDLDECAQNNGGCSVSPRVDCINTQGSRICGPCPAGYVGDGISCSRVSPCSREANNGGCHPVATCRELPALSATERICVCPFPFVGDGVGPLGCMLAPTRSFVGGPGNGSAVDNSSLVSDLSAGPIIITVNQEQDDCNPSPCLNEATCSIGDSTFECLCPAGWTGRICDEPAPFCGGKFFVSKGSIKFPPSGATLSELFKKRANRLLDKPEASGRHYNCTWSIVVAQNMSISLALNEIFNKLEPGKRVTVYTANTTKSSQAGAPTCDEYLDVREHLEDSLPLDAAKPEAENKRLLARFCGSDVQPNYKQPQELQKLRRDQSPVLVSESNVAELFYSFSASRTQFGEPSLSFSLDWRKVDPPCGGSIVDAQSGSISSPRFPDFYAAGSECRWFIQAPPGRRIRLQFGELNLLTGRAHSSYCSDSLVITEGALGPHRPTLFKHCAQNATLYSKLEKPAPVVSAGRSVEVVLYSRLDSVVPLMRAKQKRGFYLTYASEPAAETGCGGLFSSTRGTIRSADYEPFNQENWKLLEAEYAYRVSMGDPRVLSQLVEITQRSDSSNSSLFTYERRCEYEIRPATRARNHRISVDWLEMPADRPTAYTMAALSGYYKSSPGQRSNWRQIQCARSRLSIYDGNPQDGSNRTLLATFCRGDQFEPRMGRFLSLVSEGHVMYLVFESSLPSEAAQASGAATSAKPAGFKLRYSTVCSAVYSSAESTIEVNLTPEVGECVYHIVRPLRNSIALTIQPRIAASMLLPDGSCAAQAIFLDGAIQGGKLALSETERQLRTYNFKKLPISASNWNEGKSEEEEEDNDETSSSSPPPEARMRTADEPGGVTQAPRGNISGSAGNQSAEADSYWQYSSSQAHDIKEFEVCKLPVLSFNSIWNHLSLLFRLKPMPKEQEKSGAPQAVDERGPVVLDVFYQSEPSCGGIIHDLKNGTIRFDPWTKRAENARGVKVERKLSSRKENLLRSRLRGTNSAAVEVCAWILKGSPSQNIRVSFEVPVAEIRKRYSDWLKWSSSKAIKKTVPSSASSELVRQVFPPFSLQEEKAALLGIEPNSAAANAFDCFQVFNEQIELFEPEVNRSRVLCPIELLGMVNTTNSWNTLSSMLYVRLLSGREKSFVTQASNNTKRTSDELFPQRDEPLKGTISMNYEFFAANSESSECGGKLIQESGVISSPRFPFSYPPMANCEWVIQVPAGQQIRLNFTHFLVGDCADYLEIRNGPSKDSPKIGAFCGEELHKRVLVSHSRFLYLKFVSDLTIGYPGFEVHYDGAQTGCGGELRSATGQIDSPNYPGGWAHSADCDWFIEVSEPNKIELSVVDLDLSSSWSAGAQQVTGNASECRSSGLGISYLEIFDSEERDLNLMSRKSIGKFCHKSQITWSKFVSKSNKLYLKFKSNSMDTSRGFRLKYRTRCDQIEVSGTSGSIESPNSFGELTGCFYLIKAPMGSNMSLSLTNFKLSGRVSSRAALKDYRGLERRLCVDDFLEVWPIYPAPNVTNSSSIHMPRLERLSIASSRRPAAYIPAGGKLARSFCGQVNESERHIELDTNVALLNFTFLYEYHKMGFRMEWRALSCSREFRMQGTDAHEVVNYEEPETAAGRVLECLWSFQLVESERSKSSLVLEFSLDSDMRLIGASPDEPCQAASLTAHDGSNDEAPVLAKNCDSLKIDKRLKTTGSRLLVRFFSKPNVGTKLTRKFKLTVTTTIHDNCMSTIFDIAAPFNTQAGEISSPNYPDLYQSPTGFHCSTFLFSKPGGRLKISVEELEVPTQTLEAEDSPEGLLSEKACESSRNYLSFRSLSGRGQSRFFCGKLDSARVPPQQRSLVMTREGVSMDFLAKPEMRGRWRLSYKRLCGATVDLISAKTFQTPNYPNRPNWPQQTKPERGLTENLCVWKVVFMSQAWYDSPSPERKIHLNIINFIPSSSPERDCLRVYEGVDIKLTESAYNLTDMDLNLPAPRLKLCQEKDIKEKNLFYLSQGTEITVLASGDAIASFRARILDNSCGGEFRLAKAEFASPNFPNGLDSELDCLYHLVASPGSAINLAFLKFNLPDEPEDSLALANEADKSKDSICDNVDHVEIRQLLTAKKLELRMKAVEKSATSGWLHKNSREKLFVAEQEQSRLLEQYANKTNNLTISLILENRIRLIRLAKLYELFASKSGPDWDDWYHMSRSLELDSFLEYSESVGKICSANVNKLPKPILSLTRDEVLVRLRTHNKAPAAKSRFGFLARYEISYGGYLPPMYTEEEMECGGFIASPMYPSLWQHNGSVMWQLETKSGYVIQFDLVHMELGSPREDCQDSLRIYSKLSARQDDYLAKLCGHLSYNKLPDKEKGSEFDMLMRIFSGSQQDKTLFNNKTISYKWAKLPISVAGDPKVEANLARSIVTSGNVAKVHYQNLRSSGLFLLRYKAVKKSKAASIEALNATLLEALSLPIGEDEALTEKWSTEEFELAGGLANKTSSCSQSIRLDLWPQNASMTLLSSPNWPHQPPKGVDCHWLVYTREETNIRLTVDPKTMEDQQEDFYMSSLEPEYCFQPGNSKGTRNFIALYDGATTLAPLIERHCLPVPPRNFQSSGRHLLVRYVHENALEEPGKTYDEPRSLFRARASIGQCGGQYYVLGSTKIADRYNAKQKFYANNLDCKYYVFSAVPERVLAIHNEMSSFELAAEPTNANCTVGDYIEVRDLPLQSELIDDFSRWSQGRLLGRFCAGRKLEYLEAPGSALSIQFHTDGQAVARGFQLYVTSTRPRLSCPTKAVELSPNAPYGRFSSPNWPHGVTSARHCWYLLLAPVNYSIEVTFVYLRRPRPEQAENVLEEPAASDNGAQSSKCLDTLEYLDDVEAGAFRYGLEMFREHKLPWNPRLGELIREVPCKNSNTPDVALDGWRRKRPPSAYFGQLARRVMAENEADGSSPNSFKQLSLESYLDYLNSVTTRRPFTIKTDSNSLIFDYQTNNLLPNEGFVALYKLSGQRRDVSSCGGQVQTLPIGQQGSRSKNGSNLIESAFFNSKMNAGSSFVKCQFVLEEEEEASWNRNVQLRSRQYFKFHSGTLSKQLQSFSLPLIVFQVLETPPLDPNGLFFEDIGWFSETASNKRLLKSCGLNRLMLGDSTYHQGLIACGNVTRGDKYKWTLVNDNYRRLNIRTVNLPAEGGAFYRGLRAYLYESSCLQAERMMGTGFRFRSQLQQNSSYLPGVCRWNLHLDGGDYEFRFNNISFRPPEGYNSSDRSQHPTSCDPENPELDYLELRGSMDSDAPVLDRYCIHNQAQLSDRKTRRLLKTRSELTVLFVAGIKQLALGRSSFEQQEGASFGFELEIEKVANDTQGDFCHHGIYRFLRGEHYLDDNPFSLVNLLEPGFLYPKNSHCLVELSLDASMRFNFTFKGLFDLEQSRNCSNDYIQIDDLFPDQQESEVSLTFGAERTPKNNTTTTRRPEVARPTSGQRASSTAAADQVGVISFRNEPAVRRIGRWCGRNKPAGSFRSNSSSVRVTFHSNEQVSGRGFQLHYNTFNASSSG